MFKLSIKLYVRYFSIISEEINHEKQSFYTDFDLEGFHSQDIFSIHI